jgi:hypothetical protein
LMRKCRKCCCIANLLFLGVVKRRAQVAVKGKAKVFHRAFFHYQKKIVPFITRASSAELRT